MPGVNFRQLHFRVHHQIHHIQLGNHGRGLAHIVIEGIVLHLAVADAGIAHQAGRVQRIGMVVADGLHAADAGQDALASAAEARHNVVGAGAQTDHPVGVGGFGVDPHRGVVGRGTQIHQILRQTVVVHHPHPVVYAVRHQRAQLFFIAAVVSAVGHDDGHVILRDAALVPQIIHQRRDHLILPHPEPGHIADDQRHPFAGLRPLPKGRQADGIFQRGPQGIGNGGGCGHMIPVQLPQHLAFVQRNDDLPVAVAEPVLFHAHAPP